MRATYFLIITLVILLTSCSNNFNPSNIISEEVKNFNLTFLTQLKNGHVDSALINFNSGTDPLADNALLHTVSKKIKSFNLKSLNIVDAKRFSQYGKYSYTIFDVVYEIKSKEGFIYITLKTLKKDGEFVIKKTSGGMEQTSLAEQNVFTFKNKTFLHYCIFLAAIISPLFILYTIFFIMKSKINRKWLWLIGALFGLSKIGINWSTGSSGVTHDLSGLVYGNGKYIAAPWGNSSGGGPSSPFIVSTNTVSWTTVSHSLTNNNNQFNSNERLVEDISYGNNVYVGTGIYGRIIKSTDGNNWSPVSTSVINQNGDSLFNMDFLNNNFVFLSN